MMPEAGHAGLSMFTGFQQSSYGAEYMNEQRMPVSEHINNFIQTVIISVIQVR